MVMTTTLISGFWSFRARAPSRAFISSGLEMVAMAARSMVPSALTATLPEVSGTCFTQTMIFIMLSTSFDYFTPRPPEMTIRWTSEVPS